MTIPEEPIHLVDPSRPWLAPRLDARRAGRWLGPAAGVVTYTTEPVSLEKTARARLSPFAQLMAASVVGIALYVGATAWLKHQPAPQTAAGPRVVRSEAAASQRTADPTPSQRAASASQPDLPFPLPQSYGVYAASDGRLNALNTLPIKVPIQRVALSAEIKRPSAVTISGNSVAFVVYRRDLVASAPQSASVRVVARVTRSLSFVDGKAKVVPVEASWRIRDKAYELRVSPLDGHQEMILIQPEPDFVFPPGRYALVLNGYGYDFTVAGKITAPEQCLEQTQATSGEIVTECPAKS